MRALVLSGGGSKGAWQAGAIAHLMGDLGLEYDILCGTSVGAINAAFLAQTPLGMPNLASNALTQLWRNVNTSKVHKRWSPFGVVSALWKQSVYDSSPLQGWIRSGLSAGRIRTSGRKLRVVSVGIDTGESFVADETMSNIAEWVIASSAFPVMLTPALIDGKYWTDGGVRHVTPLATAIKAGATEIDILLCSDPYAADTASGKNMKAIPDILLRAIDLMNDEVSRADIRITALKNDLSHIPGSSHRYIKFRVLKPATPITVDSLDFSPANINKMYSMGYADALQIGGYHEDYTRG